MTRINCPHCNQPYDLTPEQVPAYSGQTITCTQCQNPFTVPQLAAPAPTAPTSAPASAPTGTPTPAIPYGGYAPAVDAGRRGPASGMAIAALVCGLLALIIPPLGIVAIILGIIALQKAKAPGVGGQGLAIAGISVGAVALVLGTCMISILLPSLNRARETANRIKCASNMRQIGQATLMYQVDNGGYTAPDLKTLLLTQQLDPNVACCPSSNTTPAASAQAFTEPANSSYIYTAASLDARTIAPSMVVLYEPLTNHGNDGINALFGDGHVEFIPQPRAQAVIAQNPPAPAN